MSNLKNEQFIIVNPEPCIICNNNAEMLHVFYGVHFCSEECLKELDKRYNRYNRYENTIERIKAASKGIEKFYHLDKIRTCFIYVRTLDDDSVNVFDIEKDIILFYEDHTIPDEAMEIIKRIQNEMEYFSG